MGGVLLNKDYNVAIYLRLSKEDGNEESQSIQSQREMLLSYIKSHNLNFYNEYVDDGFSGTDFNRPSFQKLIKDVERGIINMIITKDLSRLGRNYVKVGYYTEEFFPNNNVRFLALNDNYDTANDENSDFAPFKNFMNEWYAKDTSKKIRSVLYEKAKSGEPKKTVVPIYGYTFNEKFERIPDVETAPIVQLIYKKFIQTGSIKQVANFLKESRVYIPSYHNGLKYGVSKQKMLKKNDDEKYNWSVETVRAIIKREEYLGVYKTAQTKSISFKNKKRYKNENCFVFKNRYEPLIDKESWNLANSTLKSSKGSSINLTENLFKNVIFCMDCKQNMRVRREKNKKGDYVYAFNCHHLNCEMGNFILKSVLERVIVLELSALKEVLLLNKNNFIEFFINYEPKSKNLTFDLDSELKNLKTRELEVDGFIENLILQSNKGLIPNSTLNSLLSKSKEEKILLDKKIESVKLKIKNEKNKVPKSEIFNYFIKKLENVRDDDFLNSNVIQNVIKKILIKTYKCEKSRSRQIEAVIYYSSYSEILSGFFYEK